MSFFGWLLKGFQPRTPAPSPSPAVRLADAYKETRKSCTQMIHLGQELTRLGFQCKPCVRHGHALHFENRCLRCKEEFAKNDNGREGGAA